MKRPQSAIPSVDFIPGEEPVDISFSTCKKMISLMMGSIGFLTLGSLDFECQILTSVFWGYQRPDTLSSWETWVLMLGLQDPAWEDMFNSVGCYASV